MKGDLPQLLKAKARSDEKRYDEKAAILRRMMSENPADFMVDSQSEGIVGLTHIPTGFKIHLPREQVADLLKVAAVVRTVPVAIKDAVVHVEVADTPEERRTGLSGRDSLPEDHGMLFTKAGGVFWMKDVNFPLDLVSLAKSGEVLGITEMIKEADPSSPEFVYWPARGASLALELPGGWCRRHDVKTSDRVLVKT